MGGVMLALAGVVMLAPFVFMAFNQGETRAERVLRERAGLTRDQTLVLKDAGAILDERGRSNDGTTLWCGFADDDADRPVAALEGRWKRGGRPYLGSALGWAPRSAREREMLAQCAARSGPAALP